MSSLMYLMNFGTVCCLALDKLWRVWFSPFWLSKALWSIISDYYQSLAATELIEKQVKKREGSPFLWRLLVCLLLYGPFAVVEFLCRSVECYYTWIRCKYLCCCLQERSYTMTGKQEARIAGEKAMALETSYFK